MSKGHDICYHLHMLQYIRNSVVIYCVLMTYHVFVTFYDMSLKYDNLPQSELISVAHANQHQIRKDQRLTQKQTIKTIN